MPTPRSRGAYEPEPQRARAAPLSRAKSAARAADFKSALRNADLTVRKTSVFLALWKFVLRVIYDHYKVKEGRDDQEEQNQSC
jgi:hypothetical protein